MKTKKPLRSWLGWALTLTLATLVTLVLSVLNSALAQGSFDGSWTNGGGGSWGSPLSNWGYTTPVSAATMTAQLNAQPRVVVTRRNDYIDTVTLNAATGSGSSGYTRPPTVFISDPGGNGRPAVIKAILSGGSIQSFEVVDPGSGYNSTPTVLVSQEVTGILVSSKGSGYSQPPQLDFSGGGAYNSATPPAVTLRGGVGGGAVVEVNGVAAGGFVSSIQVLDGGYGYSTDLRPLITVSNFHNPSGGAVGSGLAVAPSLGLSAESFAITSGTQKYSVAPIITLSGGLSTSGVLTANATATAVLTNGLLTAVNITNPGRGYVSPPTVSITGGTVSEVGTAPSATVKTDRFVISAVDITSSGSGGYDLSRPPTLRVIGGTPSFPALATAVVEDGRVKSVAIARSGLGYTYPPTVIFSGPNGLAGAVRATAKLNDNGEVASIGLDPEDQLALNPLPPAGGGAGDAQAQAMFSATDPALAAMGVISSVNLINGGQGYVSAPTITVGATPLRNAVAVAQLEGGTPSGVGSVTVANPGNGYVAVPSVTADTSRWQGYVADPRLRFTLGASTSALATAGISGGEVNSLSLVDGGGGFDVAPTVHLVGGKGSGATGVAVISRGEVLRVDVINAGSGYGNSGAELPRVVVNPFLGLGSGAVVEADVTNGRVSGFRVTSRGSGYWIAPQITVYAGDVTEKATVTASVSGGRVTGLTLSNRGRGYTSAPLVVFAVGSSRFPIARAFTYGSGRLLDGFIDYPGEGLGAGPLGVVLSNNISNGGLHGSFQVTLSSGSLSRLRVLSPGGADRATFSATLSPGGTLGSVQITAKGSGYLSAPVLVVAAPTGVSTPMALAPSGAGSFVQFTRDTPSMAISLDAQRVVGSLSIGDAGGGDVTTFNSGTGGSSSALVFSMGSLGGGRAFFNKRVGNNDVINAPLELRDQTHLSLTAGSLTLNGSIRGTGGLMLNGGASLNVRSTSSGAAASSLWLGNRAVVDLGSRGGPIFGSVRLGDNSFGSTGGSTVLQLWSGRGAGLADRSAFLDQIDDSASVVVDATANRWGYFKLMGGDEAIGNIIDLNNAVVLENMESETINTDASLILGGNNSNSFIGGYARDRAGGAGSGTLGIVKRGTGMLQLSGGNITYTGDTQLDRGTLRLVNTNNFGSRIVGAVGTTIEIETTANMDFSRDVLGDSSLVKRGGSELTFRSGSLDLDNLTSMSGSVVIQSGPSTLFGSTNSVRGQLLARGENGIARNMRIGGSLSVGGVRVEGAHWNSISDLRLEGASFTASFPGIAANSLGYFTDAVLESRGSIEAVNTMLRMGRKDPQMRTYVVETAADNTPTVTLKDISGIVIGSVVTLDPTELAWELNTRNIPANTVVRAVNPATKQVTLSNNVKLAVNIKLAFYQSSSTDGVLRGEYIAYTSAVYDPVSAMFLAVSDRGWLYTSANGTLWNRLGLPALEGVPLRAMAIRPGVAGTTIASSWVAVGDFGRIVSGVGVDPARVSIVGTTGTGMALYGVAYVGNDRWVAVGAGGTVVHSTRPDTSWQAVAAPPSSQDLLAITVAGVLGLEATAATAAAGATTVSFADVSHISVGDKVSLSWAASASSSVVVPTNTSVASVNLAAQTVTLNQAVKLLAGSRLDFSNSGALVAVGRRGEVIRSDDQGINWNPASLPMKLRQHVITAIPPGGASSGSMVLNGAASITAAGATFANLRVDLTRDDNTVTGANGSEILRPGSMVVFSGVQAGTTVLEVDPANRSALLSMPSTATASGAPIRTLRGQTVNRVAPITGASVFADTELFDRIDHGLQTGDSVTLSGITNGAGLKLGFTYYVIRISDRAFKLADNLANARTGVPVDVRTSRTGVTLLPSVNLIRDVSNFRGLVPGMLLHGTQLSQPATIIAIDEGNRTIQISAAPTSSGTGYFGVLYGDLTNGSRNLTNLRILPSIQALSGLSAHLTINKEIADFPGRTAAGGSAITAFDATVNTLTMRDVALGSGFAPIYTIKGFTTNGSDRVSGLTMSDVSGLSVGQQVYLDGNADSADVFDVNVITAIDMPSSAGASDGELTLRNVVSLNRDANASRVDIAVFTGKFTQGSRLVSELSNRLGVPPPELRAADLRAVAAMSSTNLLAVGGFGNVLLSDDSGASWKPVTANFGKLSVRDLYTLTWLDGRMLIGGEDGLIMEYKPLPLPSTWTVLRAPDSSDVFDARQLREVRALLSGAGTMVALGRGGLAKTGASWSTSLNDTFSGSASFLTVGGRHGTAPANRAGEVNLLNQYVEAKSDRTAPGAATVIVNTNNGNRIEDSMTLRSLGGTLSFENNGANAVFTETIGALLLDQGQLRVEATRANDKGTSRLTFNALQRRAGATVDFIGRTSLGGASVLGEDGKTVNQIMVQSVSTLGVSAQSFTVDGGNAVYSVPPSVVITGGGASLNATATAVMTDGRVTGIVITNPGRGYISAPSMAIVGGTVVSGSSLPMAVGNDDFFVPIYTSPANTLDNGILGGWATAGDDWATYSATSGIARLAATSYTSVGSASTAFNASQNVRFTFGGSQTFAGMRSANSLRFDTNGAVVTLNGGTFNVESGGVLLPGSTSLATVTGGKITVAAPLRQLSETPATLFLTTNGASTLSLNLVDVTDFVAESLPSAAASAGASVITLASVEGIGPGMLVSSAQAVAPGSLVVSVNAASRQVTLDRALKADLPTAERVSISGGSVALSKSGLGTVTMNIPSSYTGKTFISGGTLQVRGEGGLSELGQDPASFSVNHLQINGGTLRFANNPSAVSARTARTGGESLTRGIQIGESGGRIQVGESVPNAENVQLTLNIDNPIRAFGVLEVAVQGDQTFTHKLILGRLGASNEYALGLKFDNTFGGTTEVIGANTIGGIFKEDGNVIIDGDSSSGGNNFTQPIRSTNGDLIFRGLNRWKGGDEFLEPIVFGGGTLRLEGPTALGTGGLRLSMLNSANLSLGGENRRIVQLSAPGSNTSISNSGGRNQAATLTMDLEQNTSYNGSIVDGTQPLRVVKTGNAALILTNSNSDFTGGLEIRSGSVEVTAIDNGFQGVIESTPLGRVESGDSASLTLNGGMLAFNLSREQTMARSFVLGSGPEAGAIVSKGTGRSSPIIIGGTRGYPTAPVAFTGNGNRILTLAGTSVSDNRFNVLLGDKSPTEITALHKSGAGTWLLSRANTYSGWTTVANGVLGTEANNGFGSGVWEARITAGATREVSLSTIKAALPEGVAINFAEINGALLPDNIDASAAYHVVDVDVRGGTFRLASGNWNEQQPSSPLSLSYRKRDVTIQSGQEREFYVNAVLPEGTEIRLPDLSGVILPSTMSASQTYVVLSPKNGYFKLAPVEDPVTPVTVTFPAIAATVSDANSLNGSFINADEPFANGLQISFDATTMPSGVGRNLGYYVVNSTGKKFQIAAWAGGSPIVLRTLGAGVLVKVRKVDTKMQPVSALVQLVPNLIERASTSLLAATHEFTGWIPVGAWVSFGRKAVPGVSPTLPVVSGGSSAAFEEGRAYYVYQSSRGRFRIKVTPEDADGLEFFSAGTANTLFYTTDFRGNNSGGVNLMSGGTLELRDVNYTTSERLVFDGGVLRVNNDTSSLWAGNIDVLSAATIQVGNRASLRLDGLLDGTRNIVFDGEGSLTLGGEALAPSLGGVNNTSRAMLVRAGELILDYGFNGQSKLVDQSPLTLGGSRRGGTVLLRGGSHAEEVSSTILDSGANRIERDGGSSYLRLNNVSRQLGGTLYVDGGRLAQVDNPNVGGLLGAWAVIRDSVTNASWVIDGTTSGTVTVSRVGNASAQMSLTTLAPHTMRDGSAIRFVSGSLPAGLLPGVDYFVADSRGAARTFRLATSYQAAITRGGSRVAFVSGQTATLTMSYRLTGFVNAAGDVISTGDGHGLSNGSRIRLSTLTAGDSLPTGLSDSQDYFVTFVETKSFKICTSLGGPPLNLGSGGSGLVAIETQDSHRFAGPASLTFRVDSSFAAGDEGNGRVKVAVHFTTNAPAEADQLVRTGRGTPNDPYVFVITISSNNGPNGELPTATLPRIVSIVANDDDARGILSAVLSSSLPSLSVFSNFLTGVETGSFGDFTSTAPGSNPAAQVLDGGLLDNGSNRLEWARAQMADGTLINQGDAFVTPNSKSEATWGERDNTSLGPNQSLLSVTDPSKLNTFSLRFGASNGATVLLDLPRTHALRSGGILVSPTVGANDVSVLGAGSITTENQGNLGNLVLQQFNPLGTLDVGAAVVDRPPVTRSAYFTGNSQRTLYLAEDADPLEVAKLAVGWSVTGTGITVGTRIQAISPGGRVLTLDRNHSGVFGLVDCSFVGSSFTVTLQAVISNPGRRVLAGIVNTNADRDGTESINVGDKVRGAGIANNTTVLEILPDKQSVLLSLDHTAGGLTRDFYEFEDSVNPQKVIRRRASLGGSSGNNRDVLFGVASPVNSLKSPDRGLLYITGTAELAEASRLAPGWLVSGPGISEASVESMTPDRRVLTLSKVPSGFTGSAAYAFRSARDATPVIINATIFSARPTDQNMVSTSDLYAGMLVSGRGIPPGTVIRDIINESDIRLSTVHTYDASWGALTFTPQTGLEKLGDGAVTLSGKNTYNGSTYIAGGKLRVINLGNGGEVGSLGVSSAASSNLLFNGSELQYQGESAQTNRGFTIADFATLNIGHERTRAVFTGSISSGTDTLRKEGSGTLVLTASMNVGTLSVEEGGLQLRTMDSNPAPGTFTATNFSVGSQTSLVMKGGKLELLGSAEGSSSQIFGGEWVVGTGGSEIRVSSQASDTEQRSSLSTSLLLMGGIEAQPITREPGGSMSMIIDQSKKGLTRDSIARIRVAAVPEEVGVVLPWAVYQTLLNGKPLRDSRTGRELVPQFAMLSGSVPAGEPAVAGYSTVVAVDNLNTQAIDYFNDARYANLVNQMQVPSSGRNISLTENVRPLFGRVEKTSYAKLLSYSQGDDGTLSIAEGKSLQLTDGAILLTTNSFGAIKEIGGESTPGSTLAQGTLRGGLLNTINSDLIVHQYNPVGQVKISAAVGDRMVEVAASNTLVRAASSEILLTSMVTEIPYLRSGMRVRIVNAAGEAVAAADTKVIGIEREVIEIDLNNNGRSRELGEIFTVRIRLDKPLLRDLGQSDSGKVVFEESTNLVQAGTGTTVLSSPRGLYTGKTYVQGGVLRVDSAGAIPGGLLQAAAAADPGASAIVMQGGVLGLGAGDFTRALGDGPSQILFTANGGFSAFGANRTVNLGGLAVPQTLRFGNGGFVPDASSLVLGSRDATHRVILQNPLDLSNYSQVVRVEDGPAAIEGELAGALSGAGRLIKMGRGALLLANSNDHRGGIEIAEGQLVATGAEDVFGVGGSVKLGSSATNTKSDAKIELRFQGPAQTAEISNAIEVGNLNARAASWVSENVNFGAISPEEFSVRLIGDVPAIAFRGSDARLRFVRALDGRAAAWADPVIVDVASQTSGAISLELVDGAPAIAYYSSTAKSLMYVRAADSQGVNWNNPVMVALSAPTAIAFDSTNNAILGGSFVGFDGEYVRDGEQANLRLVRMDRSGAIDPSFRARILNGEVRSILPLPTVTIGTSTYQDVILVAGSFTQVADRGVVYTQNRVALYDRNGDLIRGYNPSPNGDVRSIQRDGAGKIMICGAFTTYGSFARARIAKLNEDTLSLDETFTADIRNGEVRAVLPTDSNADGVLEYMVGGTFTDVGGVTRNRLVRLANSGVLDNTFAVDINNAVNDIKAWGSGYLVGGSFTLFSGAVPRQRLALLYTNGSLDETFVMDANNEVREICVLRDGSFIASGAFSQVGGTARSFVARVTPAGLLDNAFAPIFNGEVRTLRQDNATPNMLWLAGTFNAVLNDDNIADQAAPVWRGRQALARLSAPSTSGSVLDPLFNRLRWDSGSSSALCMVNGAPAIAFRDDTKAALCYVRATDSIGGSWPIPETIDQGSVGAGISMEVAGVYGDSIVKNNLGTEVTSDDTITLRTGGLGMAGAPMIVYSITAPQGANDGTLRLVAADSNNGTGNAAVGLKPPMSNWSRPLTLTSLGSGIGRRFSLSIVNINDDLLPVIAAIGRADDVDTLRVCVASNTRGLSYPDLRTPGGAILTVNVLDAPPTLNWQNPMVVETMPVVAGSENVPSLAPIGSADGLQRQSLALCYQEAATGRLLLREASDGQVQGWQPSKLLFASRPVRGLTQLTALLDGTPLVLAQLPSSGTQPAELQVLTLNTASGYSMLGFEQDRTLSGSIQLNSNVLVQVAAEAAVRWSGQVSGAGGFRLWGGGSLLLSGLANSFADSILASQSAATRAAQVDDGAVLRSGVLRLASSQALGRALLELGDAREGVVSADAMVTGSLLQSGGSFVANHNGAGSSVVNPPGAFVLVGSELDLGVAQEQPELSARLTELGVLFQIRSGRIVVDLGFKTLSADLDFSTPSLGGSFIGDLPDGLRLCLYEIGLEAKTLPSAKFKLGTEYIVRRIAGQSNRFNLVDDNGVVLLASSQPNGIAYLAQGSLNLRLLVNQESTTPEAQGVYRLAYFDGAQDRLLERINLVRVGDLDSQQEFAQGLQVLVKAGGSVFRRYFLAGELSRFNESPVHLIEEGQNFDKQVIIAESEVAIANDIDINSAAVQLGQSTGVNLLGTDASLTSGSASFDGAITLQNRRAAAEVESLRLLSNITTGNGLQFNGVISEAAAQDQLSLIKQGLGVVSLNRANGFRGGVSIEQGSLHVFKDGNSIGSATGSGPVSVADGARLAGTGFIGGLVSLGGADSNGVGAVLRVGNPLSQPTAVPPSGNLPPAPETLHLDSSLIVNADSVVEFRLGADYYTQLAAGALDLSRATPGALRVTLADNYVPQVGETFKILQGRNQGGEAFGAVPRLTLSTMYELYSVFNSLLNLPSSVAWDYSNLTTQGVITALGESRPPAFTGSVLIRPNPVTVRAGQVLPVSLSVNFDRGSDPYVMQWQYRPTSQDDWVILKPTRLLLGASESTSELDLGPARASLQGQYRAAIFNLANPQGVTSEVVTLTVTEAVSLLADLPAESKAVIGQPLVLRVSVFGSNANFVWQRSTAAAPTEADWQNVPGAANSPLLRIESVDQDALASYRVRVTGQPIPGSATANEAVSRSTRVVSTQDAVILEQPISRTVLSGTAVSFSSIAGGDSNQRTQNWLRNGAALPGEFLNVLELPSVTVAQSGAYALRVSNRPAGAKALVTATSQSAHLVVVENQELLVAAPKGRPTSLRVVMGSVAKGVNLSLQWLKNGLPLVSTTNIQGVTTATLSFKSLELSDSGTYACQVIGDQGSSVIGATHYLRVLDAPAALVKTNAPPAAVVGRWYDWKIPVTSDSADESTWRTAPLSYAATGLPAGLKLNAASGRITGRPTAASPNQQTGTPITLSIRSAVAPANPAALTWSSTLLVSPMSAGLAGNFTGLIRPGSINGNLGGRFDFTVSGSAAISGSVTLGAQAARRFAGALDFSGNAADESASAVMFIPGTRTDSPLTLRFTLQRQSAGEGKPPITRLSNASLTYADRSVGLLGWRQRFAAREVALVSVVADAYLARTAAPTSLPINTRYNFALNLANNRLGGNESLPKGSGFISLLLSNNGSYTLAGRAGDGEILAGAGTLGPAGELPIFLPLYRKAPAGSLLGMPLNAALSDGEVLAAMPRLVAAAQIGDNRVQGSLRWWRPANPDTRNLLYSAGFGPLEVTSVGGVYSPTTVAQTVLGPPLDGQASVASYLLFAENLFSVSADQLTGTLDVEPTSDPNLSNPQSPISLFPGTANRVTMPLTNPAAVTLVVTPSTGLISGSFKVQDPPVAGKPKLRAATFQGAIISEPVDGGLRRYGIGLFSMPNRSGSAIRTGLMIFRP